MGSHLHSSHQATGGPETHHVPTQEGQSFLFPPFLPTHHKSQEQTQQALGLNRTLLNPRMHAQSLSHVQLFVTPWTVAHQVSLSMEFSRQEYWSG